MTLQEYLWALPKPVLSDGDIPEALNMSYDSLSMTWKAWSSDPIKAAALRAILSCQRRLGVEPFNLYGANALTQTNRVRSFICIYCKWRKYINKIFSVL
jgi:hypothetical protein